MTLEYSIYRCIKNGQKTLCLRTINVVGRRLGSNQ
jgi:hypothetical protein